MSFIRSNCLLSYEPNKYKVQSVSHFHSNNIFILIIPLRNFIDEYYGKQVKQDQGRRPSKSQNILNYGVILFKIEILFLRLSQEY